MDSGERQLQGRIQSINIIRYLLTTVAVFKYFHFTNFIFEHVEIGFFAPSNFVKWRQSRDWAKMLKFSVWSIERTE